MMKPFVVHCKRSEYDVYIGRPSKWGNPYIIGKDGNRTEVIRKYREWAEKRGLKEQARNELRGKVLGCWCNPLPCHGDVLQEWANEQGNETVEDN